MGILGNLFRKGEEPKKSWADPILGQTEWSDDDEAFLAFVRSIPKL